MDCKTVDLVNMELFSSDDLDVRYSICVMDVKSKYAWVSSLIDEKVKTVLDGSF